jgi:hypothetical protein
MSTTSSLFLSCGSFPDWFLPLIIGITMLPMLPGALLGYVAMKKSRASHPNANTWANTAIVTFAIGLLVTLNVWFGWVKF